MFQTNTKQTMIPIKRIKSSATYAKPYKSLTKDNGKYYWRKRNGWCSNHGWHHVGLYIGAVISLNYTLCDRQAKRVYCLRCLHHMSIKNCFTCFLLNLQNWEWSGI